MRKERRGEEKIGRAEQKKLVLLLRQTHQKLPQRKAEVGSEWKF